MLANATATNQAVAAAIKTAFGTCGVGGWSAQNATDLGNTLKTASIIALLLGIIFMAVAITWKCCPLSFCKPKLTQQLAGAFFIVMGVILIIIPFISSSTTCGPLVADICAKKAAAGCPCKAKGSDIWTQKQSEQDTLQGACNALGIIFAYTAGLGFFGCILGPIVSGFGCCLACQCCNQYIRGGHVTSVGEDGTTNDGKTLVAPQTGEPIGSSS